MRRAALTVLVVMVMATPARAATTDVSVANFAFTPRTVQIAPGDTVRWTFAGPDTDHTSTSDSGQAETWESDPGVPSPNHLPGDTFPHTFTTPGQYGYFCRVHPYMRGTVTVGATSGGGQQPPPADTTGPRIGTPRVSVRRRRVTFKLNEAARVSAALRGPRTRRTLKLAGKARTNVLRLPKRLRAGRYSLKLTATDAAGNVTRRRALKFAVRG